MAKTAEEFGKSFSAMSVGARLTLFVELVSSLNFPPLSREKTKFALRCVWCQSYSLARKIAKGVAQHDQLKETGIF